MSTNTRELGNTNEHRNTNEHEQGTNTHELAQVRLTVVRVQETLVPRLGPEVQQQTHLISGGSQVVQKLFGVDFGYLFGGFHLKNQDIVDHEVGPEVSDLVSKIPHLDEDLALVGNAGSRELPRQGIPVHRLQEAEAEPVVHTEKAANHPVRDLLVKEVRVRRCCVGVCSCSRVGVRSCSHALENRATIRHTRHQISPSVIQ